MGMKVLMAPVNIAGQPIALTRELRRQGVDVSLLQYTAGEGHAFGYPSDQTVNLKGRHRMEAQTETLESALSAGYDIFHFWMSTLFGGRRYANMYGLDLPFIKARGRRIVYRGTGFDLRVRSLHEARNPHHAFQYGYELEIDEEAQRLYLRYLASYVDLFIVQDPEMHEFMPEARIVPRGIDVDSLDAVGIQPTDRPLIVHAPSKALVKGTPLLQQALAELAEEGLPFDFQLVTDVHHEEALDWYRRADIVVDQLLIGWYGVLTIEALALGKPVVVYVRDDLYDRFTPRIPVANATPETIKDVLRELIVSYEARRALAENGPSFVREVHDIRTVAAEVKELYSEVMEMPPREPSGSADIDHFLAQFKELEAADERRRERFKARKYDELLRQLPTLRFKANRADELAESVQALKRRVRDLEIEQGIPASGSGAGAVAASSERVVIDRGTLRSMHERAREFDAVSDELPQLRQQARTREELVREVQSLRYKAKRYEELREEVLSLRFTVKKLEAGVPPRQQPRRLRRLRALLTRMRGQGR